MDYPQLGLPWPAGEGEEGYPLSLVEREIKRWLGSEAADDWARTTHRLMRVQIGVFERWARHRGILHVRDITREVVRSYIESAREERCKASTLVVKAFVVRSFLAWLADEGLIPHAPRVRAPRFEPTPVNAPTVEQIEATVRACDDGTPQGYRDRALVLLLYGSACRVSDASLMNLDDLDLDARTALVRRGKGDRERTIWFTERAAEALRVYTERFRLPVAAPKHARAVFTSRVGTRLSTEMMRLVVRRRGELAGVPGLFPHKFRHAAATHLIAAGAGEFKVQKVLGHRDVKSTQRYVHLSALAGRETVDLFHPHANRPGTQAVEPAGRDDGSSA